MTRTKLNSYARWVLAAVSGLAVVVALVGAQAAGAAAPKCFGKKPTIVAGKKEKVAGTRKVDVIYAPKGDHTVKAGRGDDRSASAPATPSDRRRGRRPDPRRRRRATTSTAAPATT